MGLEMRLKTLHCGGCSDVEGEGVPKSRVNHRESLELALGPQLAHWSIDLDEVLDVLWGQSIQRFKNKQ